MNADYRRVERAIHYLESRAGQQPSLDEVAEHVGLSKYHFQRLFARWAGVSPKRFLQFLTVEHAKELLRDSSSVLETTFATGLSSPGRLHDLFVSTEAVTPGEFKSLGAGLELKWGVHESPFGRCLIATTNRGICALEFIDEGAEAREILRERWPQAALAEDAAATAVVARQAFEARRPAPLHLLLKGTNFQLKIWRALLRVPEGSAVSYGDLARAVGRPGAARPVGSAVASNRIAYLIPCHRVLRSSGAFGDYRWGSARKRAMLAWEGTRVADREAVNA